MLSAGAILQAQRGRPVDVDVDRLLQSRLQTIRHYRSYAQWWCRKERKREVGREDIDLADDAAPPCRWDLVLERIKDILVDAQDHKRTRNVLLSPGGTAFLISMFEQWVTVPPELGRAAALDHCPSTLHWVH